MHDLEPFYQWRDYYSAEEDPNAPFYERIYSEFEFTNACYDHLIHPQWDEFGAPNMFIKLLYVNYNQGAAIIEMIGEWNDAISNDIMTFKREIIDVLIESNVDKFILIGENVLNFYGDDDSYYEEWFNDIEEGWIVLMGFRDHVLEEMSDNNLDYYFEYGEKTNNINWRKMRPDTLVDLVQKTTVNNLFLGS